MKGTKKSKIVNDTKERNVKRKRMEEATTENKRKKK